MTSPKHHSVSHIHTIQKCVAEYYGVSLQHIVGTQRARRVARPRMLSMYLCKELTDFGYSAIARAFRRDHSTVMHAVTTINALFAQYPELEADRAALVKIIAACTELESPLFLRITLPKAEALNAP